jgi:hypothetical protein
MGDVTKLAVTTFAVKIDGVDVGYVDNPEVVIEDDYGEVTVQQLAKQVLDLRVLGTKVTIKLGLREISAANLGLAFPWYGGSGSVPVAPPTVGAGLYQYAVPIILHPSNVEAADTSQDYTFPKCVAVGPKGRKSDGQKDDTVDLEFRVLPDQTELPDIVLGWIGPAVA